MLLQVRDPLGAARRMNFVPQARHLSESHLLVIVDLIDGPRLDDVVLEQRFEVTVEVRDRLQSEFRGGEGVHLRDAGLLQVRGRAEVVLLGLVEQRRHDVGPLCAELEAFESVGRAPAHPLARRFRRVDRPLFPALSGALIVDQPRRDDRVAVAALPLGDGQLVIGERHATYGGDAVCEPQLERVLGVGILGRFAGVLVQADEAGQHVHPRRVDLEVRLLGRAARPQRQPGRAGAANRLDAVPRHDDVDGADRRRAGAVEEDSAAQDQRVERAASFVLAAGRRGVQPAARAGAALVRRLRGRLRLRRLGASRSPGKHRAPHHHDRYDGRVFHRGSCGTGQISIFPFDQFLTKPLVR